MTEEIKHDFNKEILFLSSIFTRVTEGITSIYIDDGRLSKSRYALLDSILRKELSPRLSIVGKGSYGTAWCFEQTNGYKYVIKVSEDQYSEYEINNPDHYTNLSARIGYILDCFSISSITPHVIRTNTDFYYEKYHILITDHVTTDLAKCKTLIDFSDSKTILVLLFQVIYTLAAINMKMKFKHNDLTWGNILLDLGESKKNKFNIYIFGPIVFKIPDLGFTSKISDFDISCVPNVENNNNIPNAGVTDSYNPYYDIYCFLYSISRLIDKNSAIYQIIQKYIIGNPDVTSRIVDGSVVEIIGLRPLNPNNCPCLNGIRLSPSNILTAHSLFSEFQISEEEYSNIDSTTIIETYNANNPVLEYDESELSKRYKCKKDGYLFLRQEKKSVSLNLTDHLMETQYKFELDLQTNEEIYNLNKKMTDIINNYAKDIKSKFNLSKDNKYCNNYTHDIFTESDAIGLSKSLLFNLIKHRRVTQSCLDMLCYTTMIKVLNYFSTNKIIRKKGSSIQDTLYSQIVISEKVVEDYFNMIKLSNSNLL